MTEKDLNALLEENRPLVYAVARSRFPSRADDPDLLQCGMIGLWEAVEKRDSVRHFQAFARTCIYHNMLDHIRRTASLRETAVPDIPEGTVTGPGLEDAELRACIINTLPPGEGRSILLGLSAGEPKRALADRLNLSSVQLTRKARAAWEKVQKKGDPA